MIYATIALDENIRVEHNVNNKVTPFCIQIGEIEISLSEKDINTLDAQVAFAIQDYNIARRDR